MHSVRTCMSGKSGRWWATRSHFFRFVSLIPLSVHSLCLMSKSDIPDVALSHSLSFSSSVTPFPLVSFFDCTFLPLISFLASSLLPCLLPPQVSGINTAMSRKREHRVLVMVVTMVLVYLMCWMPYGVMALLATFGRPSLITPEASIVPSVLAKTSTFINPIIYIFMNKQVRYIIMVIM